MKRLSHRQKAEAERKNPPEEDPEFQIAPMIDILLVLLVFFMSISSTEVLQSNRAIQLAVAKDGKAASKNNPGQVIVNILWVPSTNTGTIEIDNQKFQNPGMIIPKLENTIKNNPLARVLIRSDKAARYEYIRTVLQAVGQSGVQNVTFSVVDKEMPIQAPQLNKVAMN